MMMMMMNSGCSSHAKAVDDDCKKKRKQNITKVFCENAILKKTKKINKNNSIYLSYIFAYIHLFLL